MSPHSLPRGAGALVDLVTQATGAPLPVASPIGGPFWSIVVPVVLFAVALGATVALYRHFAR